MLLLSDNLANRFQLLSLFPTQATKTQLDEAPLTVGKPPTFVARGRASASVSAALRVRRPGSAAPTDVVIILCRRLARAPGLRPLWVFLRHALQDVGSLNSKRCRRLAITTAAAAAASTDCGCRRQPVASELAC